MMLRKSLDSFLEGSTLLSDEVHTSRLVEDPCLKEVKAKATATIAGMVEESQLLDERERESPTSDPT